MRSRVCASSPTVGSSSSRIAESWISARAISSRRFMPEDSVRDRPVGPVGQFDQASISAMRCRRSLRGTPKTSPCSSRFSRTVSRSSRLGSWNTMPSRRRAASGCADHVDAADPRRAAVGTQDRAEDVHQRRLAGAVRAEQREQLAVAHVKAHRVERQRAPVPLGDAVDADARAGSPAPRPSAARPSPESRSSRGCRRSSRPRSGRRSPRRARCAGTSRRTASARPRQARSAAAASGR